MQMGAYFVLRSHYGREHEISYVGELDSVSVLSKGVFVTEPDIPLKLIHLLRESCNT